MKELVHALKLLAKKRLEFPLIDIRKYDPDYETAMDRAVKLRDQYEAMQLKEAYRETIDSLMDALDDAEVEQISMAYLVGMMDCILVMDTLQVFKL